MFDQDTAHIHQVMVHRVGNKAMEEALNLSEHPANLDDGSLRPLLMKFFLSPFNLPEFFGFTSANDDPSLNPVFRLASSIFDRPASLPEKSREIAELLYEASTQPQTKSGDLFVVYFTSINLEEEVCDALGIFKSENKQSFLKLGEAKPEEVSRLEGINVEKLDKGCIILNTDRETGYQVCVVDRTNKNAEGAQFWKEQFLQLAPRRDEYHQTRDLMELTKEFVTTRLTDEYELSPADRIGVLNKSVAYFKSHHTFDKAGFEQEVLEDENLIRSFRSYDEELREERGVELESGFAISPEAVKKGAKQMKSVLKLDKNFHVYIHGDRNLIERGTDQDGRKYYKIYFETEQ